VCVLVQLNFSLTDKDAMIRAFDTNGRRKLDLEVSAAVGSEPDYGRCIGCHISCVCVCVYAPTAKSD